MSAPVIRTEGLTKHYGAVRALEDLDLEVRPGEVFGFLGPNGAGKTTTIRLLLDFIRPTSGRAEVLGLDARAGAVEIRRRTAYLPGDLVLYEEMTGAQHVDYIGALYDGIDRDRVRSLAERFRLDLGRPVRALSKGNRQKVGIVLAFMTGADLYVLDEPTGGLDPLMQQEFNAVLREVVADGATVFLSSHVLGEVEHVADRVGIVRAGHLVALEEIRALKEHAARRLEIRFARGTPGGLDGVPNVSDVRVTEDIVTCIVEGSMDALVKFLAQHNVEALVTHEPDLEEIFLRYYEEGGESAP